MATPFVDHVYRLRAEELAGSWLRSTNDPPNCDCTTCMLANAYLNVYHDAGKTKKGDKVETGQFCAFCLTERVPIRMMDGVMMCDWCADTYLHVIGEEGVRDFVTGKLVTDEPFKGEGK